MLKKIIKAQLNKDFEKIIIAKINKMAEDRIPIAKVPNSQYKLYLKATILNGFNYLEFTFICGIDIKTTTGCTITFKSENDEFTLKSESHMIESDYTIKSEIGITIVDTDLEDDFIAFVKNNKIESIQLDCKMGQIIKKSVSFSYSDIDMNAFATSMIPKEAEASGEMTNPGGGSSLGI